MDSTIAGTSTTQCTAQGESDDDTTENKNNKTVDMKNYKQFFRELDWDIWVMLSLPLTLNPEPEKVIYFSLCYRNIIKYIFLI